MALPAGRYGVTKNQLLKIKKLPMNTIKLIEELTEKFNLLGTAAFKNSTSVVTDSSDLVESGAVEQTLRDAEVIEGNNLYADEQNIQFGSAYNLRAKTIPLTKPLGAGTYTFSWQSTGTADIKIQIHYNGSYHFPSLPYIFTVNSGSTCDSMYIYIPQTDYDDGKSATVSKIQIGATPLKDVVPNKCDNSVIGTVEDGTNPTKAYAVDEFMVRNGAFCQVTAPVTTSSTWSEGSNYTRKSIAVVLQSLMS